MDRYKIVETISEQEYGMIAKAINLQTKQPAILKILKKRFYSWQECMNTREIKSLRSLQHSNIIQIREIIKQNDEILCVYEYYDQSLFDYYQELRDRYQELHERQIKEIMFQIISAVHYMHGAKYFHRDLCPETICVINNPSSFFHEGLTVKISAFNVAREIMQRNPQYTDYITTRWYRAPEQLVHSIHYNHKVDIWAIGCIMAELFLLGPLLNGVSEQDQLSRIIKVFGTPNEQEFPEFFTYASSVKFQIVYTPPVDLATLLPTASPEAIDLLKKIFRYSALLRPSCEQILKHPFFSELNITPPEYDTPSNIIQKSLQNQQKDNHQAEAQEQEKNKSGFDEVKEGGQSNININSGKVEYTSKFSQFIQKQS